MEQITTAPGFSSASSPCPSAASVSRSQPTVATGPNTVAQHLDDASKRDLSAPLSSIGSFGAYHRRLAARLLLDLLAGDVHHHKFVKGDFSQPAATLLRGVTTSADSVRAATGLKAQ